MSHVHGATLCSMNGDSEPINDFPKKILTCAENVSIQCGFSLNFKESYEVAPQHI